MRRTVIVSITLVVCLLLTVLTQVGGVVLLLLIGVAYLLRKRFKWLYKPLPITLGFPLVYLLATFTIVPLLASITGRVALPCFGGTLQPLTLGTCICNRHYAKPVLLDVAQEAANAMAIKYPGSKLYYLDANFPFINGFPLIPHLSHNDGKKLDLAFYYQDAATGEAVDGTPSAIGYGVFEDPKPGETNQPAICAKQRQWQYSFMEKIIPQDKATVMCLDEARTKALLVVLGKDNRIKKMFLEPHLKERMGLTGYGKIRYQGCHSVRHDDHVHVQL